MCCNATYIPIYSPAEFIQLLNRVGGSFTTSDEVSGRVGSRIVTVMLQPDK